MMDGSNSNNFIKFNVSLVDDCIVAQKKQIEF